MYTTSTSTVSKYVRTADKKYRFGVPFKVLTKQVALYKINVFLEKTYVLALTSMLRRMCFSLFVVGADSGRERNATPHNAISTYSKTVRVSLTERISKTPPVVS